MPPSDEALLALVGDFYEHVDPVPPGVVERTQEAIAYDWRALTVKQPWAACLASGQKLTENRTWATRQRGPFLIHAGVTWDAQAAPRDATAWVKEAWAFHRAPAHLHAQGAILAVADLDDCHPYEPGCCATVWAEKAAGLWHWVLGSVRALPEPVPCKGSLSLWRPSPDVLAAVLKQIGGAS